MRKFLDQCKRYFVYAGIFSLFINLLMLSLPIYMMQVFNRVITSRSVETLVMLTIAVFGAFILHLYLELIRSQVLLGAGLSLDGLAGPAVVNGVLTTGALPGTNANVAGLRDVAVLRSFLTGKAISALFDSPWVPVYLGVIFLFHPLLGIVATLGAIAIFGLAYVNEKLTRAPLDELSRETRRASYYIDSGLRNSEVAGALGMVGDLVRRWQKLNLKVLDAQVIAARRSGVMSGLTRFMRISLQILMLCIGTYLVIQQHVSAGIMIAGTLILSRALAPIETAIHTWKGFVDARESYARLSELLESVPDAKQRVELPAPVGRLELDRVTFAIPGKDRQIIKGVSFTLQAGESLGLIGPSAAGKSTLARLVTGIWRPGSGTVRLDGADVSSWPRDQLGPYIGYLPQDVELFAGTVAENIARLKEGVPAEAIISAAKSANAHDMIVRLPQAYDTPIGVAGTELSAGQRQRVALARALFGRPKFVVLDEPNSNLDTEGEDALVETLRTLKKDDVTVIIISHRPSILSQVDKLLVLKDGQREIFGPRAEVLARVTPKGISAAEPLKGDRGGRGPQAVNPWRQQNEGT